MSKVFIDIGGHTGQSIKRFYDDIKDAYAWRIYSFEPIQYNTLVKNTAGYGNVECIKAVVGIKSEIIEMFPVPAGGQGATIAKGKLTGDVDYKNIIAIQSINFIEWFKKNISEDDFVVIKMNIEGGEYILMPTLYEILPQIQGLHIKLHHNKFEEEQKLKFLSIYNDFKLIIPLYRTFVFCDITEGDYNFKWLVEKANEK